MNRNLGTTSAIRMPLILASIICLALACTIEGGTDGEGSTNYSCDLTTNSGGCISVGDDSDGLFLPGKVYLWGTLSPGLCGREAVTTPELPDEAALGFYCDARGYDVHVVPGSGVILYWNSNDHSIREFTLDLLVATTFPKTEMVEYPDNTIDNDPARITPNCLVEDGGAEDFMVSGDGDVIHQCADDIWYGSDGSIVYDGPDTVLHFGTNGLALVSTVGRQVAIVELGSGALTMLSAFDELDILTQRATTTGFVVIIEVSTNPPELWSVEVDGTETMLGTYPDVPAGFTTLSSRSKMDSSTALFQTGGEDVGSADVIVRRIVNGPAEIVYTEANDPRVQMHASYLFTGP